MIQKKRYGYLIGANGPEVNGQCLKYAENDVIRLSDALRGSNCHFDSATKYVIAHSRSEVLSDLNHYIKQCASEDVLLVHFSGHAIFDGTLYLVCNNTDVDDLVSSAININDIKHYLQKCRARYKVLILDCCHSAGAVHGVYKSIQDVREVVSDALQGSGSIIIAACPQHKLTRELDELDGGSGFLSWAVRAACTSRFHDAAFDKGSLSVEDVWEWILKALKEVNNKLSEHDRLPNPVFQNLLVGENSKIWLTDPPEVNPRTSSKDSEIRRKYLEFVSRRYSSVELPIGPAEGLSLHAIFQPLALRHDPLAEKELGYKQPPPLVGKDRTRLRIAASVERQKKEGLDAKELPDLAEHGEDALRKSPQGRMVILGGPGTGKTTTLKYLIGRQAKKALIDPVELFPIFLSLADLARSGKSLQSYLGDLVEDMGIEKNRTDILWREIEYGHAFVALDGLDEVSPEQRSRMIDLINSQASEPGNIWLVGSRFSEYKGGQFKPGQFAEWELLPMTSELCYQLVNKLLPELQRVLLPKKTQNDKNPSSEDFWKYLNSHPHAAAWCETPLLLSLAAVVYTETGTLPASRAALYHDVTEAILTLRSQYILHRAYIQRILAKLALWLHQFKMRTFNADQLYTFLEENQYAKSSLENIANRIIHSGVMEILAKDTYSFRHQTFQEYFAAVELAKQFTSHDQTIHQRAWDFAWGKCTYSRWTEVLRLMIGILAQSSHPGSRAIIQSWLDRLIKQRLSPDGDPGHLGLALALKSLDEISEMAIENKIIASLETKIVSTWLDELTHLINQKHFLMLYKLDGFVRETIHCSMQTRNAILNWVEVALGNHDRDMRKMAAKVLEVHGKYASQKLLLAALQDQHWFVRRIAIDFLAEQAEDLPFEALLAALYDKDIAVQRTAISIVSRVGEKLPLEPFLIALQSQNTEVHWPATVVLKTQWQRIPLEPLLEALGNEDEYIREGVVEILSMMQERLPLETLLNILRGKNKNARQAALQVLGATRQDIPAELLLQALQDPNKEVRRAAILFLRNRSEKVPLESLLLKSLICHLSDKDKEVREATEEVLSSIEGDVLFEFLIEALRNENQDNIRRAAINILKERKARIPFVSLLPVLQDQDAYIRQGCVELLSVQDEPMPLEVVFTALQDHDKGVQLGAIKALKAQKGTITMFIQPLLMFLQKRDEDTCIAAIEVLGELGKQAPLEPLLAALEDQNKSIRFAAIKALIAQGERVPLEVLFAAFRDEDTKIRSVAASIMLTREEAVPSEIFLTALHDQDAYVCLNAITILKKRKEHIPFESLLGALQRRERDVRQKAAEVLRMQKEPVSPDFLLTVFQSRDEDLQQAVLEILKIQDTPIPLDYLLEALQNQDKSTRQWVIKILGKLDLWETKEFFSTLQNNGCWLQKQAAIEIMGAQGEIVPDELLFDALHDQNHHVRWTALKALKTKNNALPLAPLLAMLKDPVWYIRKEAVEALGSRSSEVPINVLIEILYDQDKQVRRAAMEVLKRQKELALEPLLSVLHSSNSDAKKAAAELLTSRGEYTSLESSIVHTQCMSTSQEVAKKSLNSLKKQATLESLLEDLYDEKLWLSAQGALIAQGDRVPIEPLFLAAQSHNGYARFAAINVLKGLECYIPLDILLTALQDKDQSVRYAAAEALGKQGKRVPLEPLLVTLQDQDNQVRWAALEALAEIGKPVPLEPLLPLLRDQEWYIRFAAMKALGTLGQEAPLELLFAALHDEDNDVKETAVRILGMRGESIPFEPLFAALQDQDENVRRSAVEVISSQGDRVPIDPLLDALYNRVSFVRLAVLEILSARGEQVPIRPLLDALQDDNREVGNLAAQILSKVYPEELTTVADEARAILQHQPAEGILSSLACMFVIDVIGDIGYTTPASLAQLTEYLNWSYWQVRMDAARVLGQFRNVPDNTIRRLLDLRRSDPVKAVREVADEALAEILSLETGIEDD